MFERGKNPISCIQNFKFYACFIDLFEVLMHFRLNSYGNYAASKPDEVCMAFAARDDD